MVETAFQKAVYRLLMSVPAGKVTTYGDLARQLTTSPRAVGQALKRNPYAPTVPCHRVVMADGSLGGFKGERTPHALREKRTLLQQEGIRIAGEHVRELASVRHRWSRGRR